MFYKHIIWFFTVRKHPPTFIVKHLLQWYGITEGTNCVIIINQGEKLTRSDVVKLFFL